MKSNALRLVSILIISTFALSLVSCSVVFQSGRRSDVEKIEQLSQELDNLSQTKALLENRLRQEISDKQVKLKMAEKGLVITFVADVMFDSGKDTLKQNALSGLDKVARVLSENVPDLNVGIEGYTDNVPIKVSGWKSNWELSTARALSVLHYLADKKGIDPKRLSAIGYGEYKPVASNDTKAGRQANRRVEVVIIPQVKKVKNSGEPKAVSRPSYDEENLK